MKKFTLLLPTILLLLLSAIFPAQAQNCSLFTGSGGDIFPDKRCAPVGVTLQARFFSQAGPDVLSNFQIRVDWADGSTAETFVPSATLGPDGKTWIYEVKNITHTYPEGGDKCNYEVYARPVVNGAVCNSQFYKGNVTVWDKDNSNGGEIAINPQYYYVCPGEEFSLSFNDVSVWNCTPPLENDNVNWPARWTQFIYGTGTTAGPRIAGVEVNGALQGYPYSGIIKPHADWQLGPDHTSYLVRVPATAQVGQMFEITLRNWNACNPYDDPAVAGGPGNVQNGDYAPVTNIAIIKIVDRPAGTITTKNKNNVITDNFCPGEKVIFEGQETNPNVDQVQYDWLIFNDAAGTELLQEKRNTKNWARDAGFPTAGQKLIRLRIRNRDAANSCWTEIEKIVNVYAAPEANTTLNGVPGELQEICWAGAQFPMEFGFPLFSANNYKYQLSLYRPNSAATSPDGAVLPEQSVSGGQSATATYNLNITAPGIYKVRVTATDLVTGCNTIKESRVIVYDKPQAVFSFDPLCDGQPVIFTDASRLGTSVNGDTLKTWQWDIDYNGSSFSFDYTGKEGVSHQYPAPGTYQVALLLTSSKGCTDTLIQNVEVKPVPTAALTSSYTQPICPGEPIVFTNTSVNNSSSFPNGITYTLAVQDGTSISRSPMTATSQEIRFTNATGALKTYYIWLEAKANAPNNCSVASDTLQVVVKPGATAGFLAPGYDALAPNCTPLELLLVTNQATRAIQADRYIWTVSLGGTEIRRVVQERGTAGFDTLRYAATNTGAGSLTYVVRLIAEKANQCINPSEERYRVNPVPQANFTVTQISQTCEETVLEVQVSNPAGISNYNWTIFPEPTNISTVTYDDRFQLVYARPTVAQPSYPVDLKLITQNYFECPSTEVAQTIQILPQVLGEVKAVVVSAENQGCSPLTVEFENQSVAPAGTTYRAMLRHGSAPEQELVPVSGSLNTRFIYTFVNEGNYQVWLIATAPDGCVRYQTIPAQAVVYPASRPFFSLDKQQGCGPLTVSINKVNVTGATRTWTVTDLSTNQPVYGPTRFDPASTDNFSYITLENTTAASKQFRISLQTASSQGCTADSSLLVTVHPQPTAQFEVVGGTNLCEPYTIQVKNNSTNPAGTTYTWEWGDGTTTTSSSINLTKTYTNTSYTATLTFPIRLTTTTPNGCTAESVLSVTVAPRVLAAFDADKLSGCAPLQVNFTNNSRGNTGTGSGWFMRTPGTTDYVSLGATLNNYTFTNTGNSTLVYDVRYVAANSAGCTDVVERQITVQPELQIQLVPSNTEACHPNTVTFTITNQSPQSNMRYTWQWGDGSADEVYTNANPVTHSFENASTTQQRTYTVRLLAENTVTGCSISIPQEIRVYPQVVASVVPSTVAACSPLQLSFQNNSQNAATHSWRIVRTDTGQEVYASSDRLPVAQSLVNDTQQALTYIVTYVASSAQGCSSQQQHTITVYPTVAAAFSMDRNQGCSPATITFTNTAVQANVTYTWQWGDGSADEVYTTAAPVTHSFENASTSLPRVFTVRLLARNTVTGCTATTTQEVTVYPQLIANVSPTLTEGCGPLQVGFQNNTQNASTHYWRVVRRDTGVEVYTTAERMPDIPLLSNSSQAPVVYEVLYRATSANGCTAEQQHAITVYPGIAAMFEMDQNNPACGPTTVTFTNRNVQPGVRYIWQWGDGNPNDTTTTEAVITHTFTNDRTDRSRYYEVTFTAQNIAYGCSSVQRKTVVVSPTLEVTVAPDRETLCAPGTVNFSNRSLNVASHSWWYRLQGTQAQLEPRNTAEVQYLFINATDSIQVFEVVYTGTNSNGCSKTAVSQITVYPELAPAFTLDRTEVNLPDASAQITNTTPHAEAWTYTWNFGDGTTSTEVHPGVKTYTAFGTYTITLTISNGLCSASVTREVNVGDTAPVVEFETVPVSGCAPLLVQFNNSSQYTDPNSYYWDFGDGEGYSTAENPSYTYFTPGEYTVTLTARNRTGETSTQSRQMVTVYEVPKADFAVRDEVVYVPGDPVYVANYSEGADTYFWDFGDGTTYTEESPVHYYQQPGVYSITLVASNQWGCSDTLTLHEVVTAEAGGEIKIPNAFTPDLNGPNSGSTDIENNDVFFPVLNGGVTKYNLRIYNRWGELLFETTDRKLGWNGYYKGRLCKADVYAYKIYVEFSDGKTLQQIGDITLIR